MISLHTQTQYAKPVSVFKTVNKISKGFSKTTVCVDIAYEMRVLREWRDFVKKKGNSPNLNDRDAIACLVLSRSLETTLCVIVSMMIGFLLHFYNVDIV